MLSIDLALQRDQTRTHAVVQQEHRAYWPCILGKPQLGSRLAACFAGRYHLSFRKNTLIDQGLHNPSDSPSSHTGKAGQVRPAGWPYVVQGLQQSAPIRRAQGSRWNQFLGRYYTLSALIFMAIVRTALTFSQSVSFESSYQRVHRIQSCWPNQLRHQRPALSEG
ncbi:hypothetical protein BA011_35015 (plasmid) [Rhizobium leguminosarum]|uniref:Uncharacterized protein n=1 Tax=Rhizobium leguminosarum TaxID=384 RepID=A0A1B1CMT1_RHILE|nr:hypothetical protein BA011_35015 [Rhizobium leguminosarum]